MTKQSRVPVVARLVALGLAKDASHARELIDRRVVLAQGSVVDNASRLVASGDSLVVKEPARFVSRGGHKLDHALLQFKIEVTDKVVLDVGASTGGFTDCALQHGAAKVYALDVGRTQLHERLQSDPRVVVVEEFNARHLADPERCREAGLPESFDLLVVDVSFISVARLSDQLASVLSQDSDLVVLIKPQFEATKEEADRAAGVIESQEIHTRVISEVRQSMADVSCDCLGVIESPITGSSGNTEFLAHFRMRS